eukprot:scaffold140798_cov54-Cyclotella_meneghiniana.AAC.3
MAEMDATQQKPKQKKKTRHKTTTRAASQDAGQLDGIEAAREELGEEAMKAIVAEVGKEKQV